MQSMPFLVYFGIITQWSGQLLIPQKFQQI